MNKDILLFLQALHRLANWSSDADLETSLNQYLKSVKKSKIQVLSELPTAINILEILVIKGKPEAKTLVDGILASFVAEYDLLNSEAKSKLWHCFTKVSQTSNPEPAFKFLLQAMATLVTNESEHETLLTDLI